MSRGASHLALRRAKELHGIVMEDGLWAELARGLAAGEHRLLGRQAKGTEKYSVELQLDDGSTRTMLVIFDPARRCVVTVLPSPAASKPPRPPRRRARRRPPNLPLRDGSIDPSSLE